jgi:hypothetical protein
LIMTGPFGEHPRPRRIISKMRNAPIVARLFA